VPKEGLEPSHPKAQEPKSCVSTSSTTPAVFNCFAPLTANRALEPAYFVPQFAAGAVARYARASLMWSFAEERTPPLTPPQHSSPLGLVLASLAPFDSARRPRSDN
jgi:hypothetical protein